MVGLKTQKPQKIEHIYGITLLKNKSKESNHLVFLILQSANQRKEKCSRGVTQAKKKVDKLGWKLGVANSGGFLQESR